MKARKLNKTRNIIRYFFNKNQKLLIIKKGSLFFLAGKFDTKLAAYPNGAVWSQDLEISKEVAIKTFPKLKKELDFKE
jgi:hypothetical protein